MDQMLSLFLLRHAQVLFGQRYEPPVELEHCAARYSSQKLAIIAKLCKIIHF